MSYESIARTRPLPSTETTSTSLAIDMKREVQNWESIFRSVTSVTTVVSMDEGRLQTHFRQK